MWTDRATKQLSWAHKSDGTVERQATSVMSLGAVVSWDAHQQPQSFTSKFHWQQNIQLELLLRKGNVAKHAMFIGLYNIFGCEKSG